MMTTQLLSIGDELLEEVRKHGSVMTWRDRRADLYPDWS